jgi:hypothetical protein
LNIVDFISEERLITYEKHVDRQDKAIVLHNHTLQLGSSLMSMIALLELSLRNSTNIRLIEDFGDESWLLPDHSSVPLKEFESKAVKSAVRNARKGAYSKLSYKEKGFLDAFAYPGGVPKGIRHETQVKKRQDLFVVSHGQVVSQTMLSFWKRLYGGEYEHTLWKPSLKRVFPDKNLKRPEVSKALEIVYATRNRVAHHEPVYGQRLTDVMSALEFLRNSLGSNGKGGDTNFQGYSRIQYLRLRMDYESFLEAWRTLT